MQITKVKVNITIATSISHTDNVAIQRPKEFSKIETLGVVEVDTPVEAINAFRALWNSDKAANALDVNIFGHTHFADGEEIR